MRGEVDADNGKGDGWMTAMEHALGDALDAADFDTRFIRYLIRLLDSAGFVNLSFAILRSALDVVNSEGDREEFDGLVDLGIQLMSREGRRLSLDEQEWESEPGRDG